MGEQNQGNFRKLVRTLRKQQEAGGFCLKCGEFVDGDQISRARFPAFHKGCDGEVAFHIDIEGAFVRGDKIARRHGVYEAASVWRQLKDRRAR